MMRMILMVMRIVTGDENEDDRVDDDVGSGL